MLLRVEFIYSTFGSVAQGGLYWRSQNAQLQGGILAAYYTRSEQLAIGTVNCPGCCPKCDGACARDEGTGTCYGCQHSGHKQGCAARQIIQDRGGR